MHEQSSNQAYVMNELLNPEYVNAELEAMFGPDAFGEAEHDGAIHGLGSTALAPLTEQAIEAETAAAFAFHDAQFTSEELAAAARAEDVAVARVAAYYEAQRQQQDLLDHLTAEDDKRKEDKAKAANRKQPAARKLALKPGKQTLHPRRGGRGQERNSTRPFAGRS